MVVLPMRQHAAIGIQGLADVFRVVLQLECGELRIHPRQSVPADINTVGKQKGAKELHSFYDILDLCLALMNFQTKVYR